MDYRKLFEEVAAYLEEHGYPQAVRQVRDELANGRLSEEKIGTLAEVPGEQSFLRPEAAFRRGGPGEFVRRDEYTDAESVVLLLEAARRAICDASVMVDELRDAFVGTNITGVVFESERGDEDGFSVPFSQAVNSMPAREAATALDHVIGEIRRS